MVIHSNSPNGHHDVDKEVELEVPVSEHVART